MRFWPSEKEDQIITIVIVFLLLLLWVLNFAILNKKMILSCWLYPTENGTVSTAQSFHCQFKDLLKKKSARFKINNHWLFEVNFADCEQLISHCSFYL